MSGFVHLELSTTNPSRAKTFYEKTFGWKTMDVKVGKTKYTMVSIPGNGPDGGIQKKPMPRAPTMWLPYVAVGNIRRAVAKAKKNGAKIIVEQMSVPGFGELALIEDPTGAALGLWKAAPAPTKKTKKKSAKKKTKTRAKTTKRKTTKRKTKKKTARKTTKRKTKKTASRRRKKSLA